jgi:hypothetical protein
MQNDRSLPVTAPQEAQFKDANFRSRVELHYSSSLHQGQRRVRKSAALGQHILQLLGDDIRKKDLTATENNDRKARDDVMEIRIV